MKIVLVDDHAVFREGLKLILEGICRYQVVGEAGSARAALPIIDACKPDLVVLDLGLPGMDGFSAAREIGRRWARVRLLAITASDSPQDLLEALHAGFQVYALKAQPLDELLEAFRKVQRGETYVPPALADVAKAARPKTTEGGRRRPCTTLMGLLSVREREVFRLAVAGSSNADIARELCISHKTVETHRYRLQKKLGVRNVVGLVRLAAVHGLIPMAPSGALSVPTEREAERVPSPAA